MNQLATQLDHDATEEIQIRYQILKQQQPHIRARNAAETLGISEAHSLLLCR